MLYKGLVIAICLSLFPQDVIGAQMGTQLASLEYAKLTKPERREWQRLLGYRGTQGNKAPQVSEKFFLSSASDITPEREFESMRMAMIHAPQVVCRFPARVKWIEKVSNQEPRSFSKCGDYLSWKSAFLTEFASIVYATPSMESPSAMFGHNFLRFFDHNTPFLASSALNYNAVVNEQVGFVTYVHFGLWGGFWGEFDVKPLHRRLREYTDNQSRDLWEYELDLTQQQVEQLVDLAWEARSQVHKYYFVGDNCAFRLVDLLAAVEPRIQPQMTLNKTIPIETISQLDDLGLIKARRFYPAKKRSLKDGLSQLTERERKRLNTILSAKGVELEALISTSSRRTLEVAMQMLDYRISHSASLNDLDQASFYKIGEALANMSLGGSDARLPEAPIAPENLNDSTKWSLGVAEVSSTINGKIGFRYSGYDYLETPRDLNGPAVFEFLAIDVFVSASDAKVNQVSLLNVESYSEFSYFFPKFSWGIFVGAKPVLFEEKVATLPTVDSKVGLTLKEGAFSINMSTLIGANFKRNRSISESFFVGYANSMIYDGKFLSSKLEYQKHFNNRAYLSESSGLVFRSTLHVIKNMDFTLSMSRWQNTSLVDERVEFSVGHYF